MSRFFVLKKIVRTRKKEFVLVLFLFFVAAWIRLLSIEFPPNSTDPGRDFYVGRHILEYRELPEFGPVNAGSQLIRNSPFYFYYAAFLSIFSGESYFRFILIHVFVSSLLIVPLYNFGKLTGGITVAIMNSVLFIFGSTFIASAKYIFMPGEMLIPLVIGYALLLRWHIVGKNAYTIWAMVMFALACSLHFSAAFLMPGILVFLALNTKRESLKHIVLSLGAFVLIIVLFYFNSIVFFLNETHHPLISLDFEKNVSLQSVVYLTIVQFYEGAKSISLARAILIIEFLVCFLGGLLYVKKLWKWELSIVLSAVTLPILVLLVDGSWYQHYSFAIITLFTILLSLVVSQFKWHIKVVITTILSILLFVTYFNFQPPQISDEPLSSAVNAVVDFIESSPDVDEKNFTVEYRHDGGGGYEGEFLYLLEKRLDTKLATVNARTGSSIEQINPQEFVIRICKWTYKTERNCVVESHLASDQMEHQQKIYSNSEYDIFFLKPNS